MFVLLVSMRDKFILGFNVINFVACVTRIRCEQKFFMFTIRIMRNKTNV